MADISKAKTIELQKGVSYAKVAERLRIFREENPNGKHESSFEMDVDSTMVFTVWLWKDKTDLIDLMKAGVTDINTLRTSADANGNAKGGGSGKDKEFEKLETIALGRSLANLGYLASGEIASSEEIEQFQAYKKEQVSEIIGMIKSFETLDELKHYFLSLGSMMAQQDIIKAKDVKKAQLLEGAEV